MNKIKTNMPFLAILFFCAGTAFVWAGLEKGDWGAVKVGGVWLGMAVVYGWIELANSQG